MKELTRKQSYSDDLNKALYTLRRTCNFHASLVLNLKTNFSLK